MKKIAIISLITGVLSIGCLTAQSDFGQKQHRNNQSIQVAENQSAETSTTKTTKQTNNYSLPFTENYESGVFQPIDWTTFIGTNGAGGSYNWESTTDGYGGDAAFVDWDNVGGAVCEDWMVSPLIDLGTNSELIFYEKQDYSTDYGSNYNIKISTATQTTHSDFTTIISYGETDFSTSYSLRQIDLSAYDGQSVYIAFVMTNDDGDSWYVDNIVVEESTSGGTTGGDLLISEVAFPAESDGDIARFVELYNSGDNTVDLTDYDLSFYKKNRDINLSGSILPGETFIYAPDATDFFNTYGFYPDQSDDGIDPTWFNGTDAVMLV
ncbi:MAG: hypothetical protein GQ527_08920, partial [Bacteroidales bacterium]|nr:hypothetical protein [Bacteroidales bacterium]